MKMIVRRFKRRDAENVWRLISKTFSEFIAPTFTKKATEEWLKKQVPGEQIKRARTRDIFVAEINNKIVGVIAGKENKKITRLFVDKKYQRKGIARSLVNKIEKLYRKRGSKKILVFSSLYAEKFYGKMGFKKTTGAIRKKGMVYQPMKKNL